MWSSQSQLVEQTQAYTPNTVTLAAVHGTRQEALCAPENISGLQRTAFLTTLIFFDADFTIEILDTGPFTWE